MLFEGLSLGINPDYKMYHQTHKHLFSYEMNSSNVFSKSKIIFPKICLRITKD